MTDLAPQLAFPGRCREAFEVYAELLGGRITVMNSFGGHEDRELPPGSQAGPADKVRFAELRIGEVALRGVDVGEDEFTPMAGFSLSLHLADETEARRVFDALADGGNVTTPLTEVDWAQAFGMVRDRFGVPWLILALNPQ